MPHVPPDNPDRVRWNARYASATTVLFDAHPLAELALAEGPPDGPVLDLACGPGGSALLAAASGRRVTAVDVSEVALDMLDREARDRGLRDLVTPVQADLTGWRPPEAYAVVLCADYWDGAAFPAARDAVAPGGLLGWEAFTTDARATRPSLPEEWCLAPGEPATLLGPGFTVLIEEDLPGGHGARRRLLARRDG